MPYGFQYHIPSVCIHFCDSASYIFGLTSQEITVFISTCPHDSWSPNTLTKHPTDLTNV